MTGTRRGRVAVVLALVAAGAATGTWAALGSGSAQPRRVVDNASSVTTIAERTITSQRQVDGTLGFAGATTVLQPVGTSPDTLVQADQKAAAAERSLAQARSDLSAAEATLSADFQALAADQTRLDPDQQRVDADSQRVGADRKAVADAQAAVATAEQVTPWARSAAADAHATALAFGPTSVYSTLPDIGSVVTRGQPLFSVSAQPVPLLYGSVIPWRAFSAGMSGGADVAELNQNLADLGYGAGLAGSDTFAGATTAAVRHLQRALGVAETGELRLGAVVFEPGPVRVAGVTPKRGAAVQPGAPVLDVTSTTRRVDVKLDAAAQSEIKVGDPVTITLPDNRTTAGTVTTVGTVASQPASSGQDSSSQPTVDLDITPTDGEATGNLDAAPVEVSITTASADHALVVPVAALLAVGGGGYGVDVIAGDGVHHLEAVTLGLFDDAHGLVQITGSTVHAGEKVAVASA